MIIRRTVPVYASSLIEVIQCHLGAAGAPLAPAALREVLAARLTDPRKPRGIRHVLAPARRRLGDRQRPPCPHATPATSTDVLGNQPGLYAELDALDWENTPVAAATAEITRGRIETPTIRVLPAPDDLGFPHAGQAILLERYVTIKKDRQQVMRNCEAVLYVTSLDAAQASPADLLAYARGHWRIERLHWRRDLARRQIHPPHGQRPQVMSALTNLVITLFRLQGVTKITAETRRNAQNPRRPFQPPSGQAKRALRL
jgi:hypothetical protein